MRTRFQPRAFINLGAIAVALASAWACRSQTPAPSRVPSHAIAAAAPEFEAASIKPVKDPDPGNMFDKEDGRHFLTHDTTLLQLLVMAYHVDKSQIVAVPEWASTEQYDVDAVAETDVQLRQHLRELLQALLADRFQVVLHREQRYLQAYVLTIAKGGPKMTPSDPKGQHASGCQGLGVCTFRQEDMAHLASWLALFMLDRPVVDKTGLTAPYDFTLRWTPDGAQAAAFGAHVPSTSADAADAPPGLFTAMQEQLGLKLVPEKAPAEVLVLDHVARPEAN